MKVESYWDLNWEIDLISAESKARNIDTLCGRNGRLRDCFTEEAMVMVVVIVGAMIASGLLGPDV